MGRTAAATFAAVLGICAISAVALAGDGPSRDEYVSQLEAICKPQAEATQRAMAGVRDDVHAGRIAVAAHKFTRAAAIFGETVRSIARVQRPAPDTARLKQWFIYLNRQEDYLKQIAAELHARHTIRAQRLTARFIHNGNMANNVTLDFGFNYCSFRFSRFG